MQVLHNLGGERNAQKVLKELSPYVECFRDGENVYYLNAAGRSIVGGKPRAKTLQARHFIMRNSLYIAFGQPETWKSETRLKVNKQVSVVADAIFYDEEGTLNIVEVDHTQTMAKNAKKLEKYTKLLELGVFKSSPRFIWITMTEYRRKKIKELSAGMHSHVFTAAEFN